MSEARWITADVFDGLATLEDGTVDLVVTSPPFIALRSYLPADHPDKHREIGSEATPAEFLDTLLAVTAELRRVLAPHGSICVELGDTYAGSGGAGGDYTEGGMRQGQNGFTGSARRDRIEVPRQWSGGHGWPEPKSKTLIPELYRIALAYGINPLTGQPSPAGRWRVRNTVTWCRPNPPVGALGDKWRPATSDVVVACVSPKRYWDDLATRQPHQTDDAISRPRVRGSKDDGYGGRASSDIGGHPSGAPLLDYWVIPPGGYRGAHYAVFPPELVVPLLKAMCPEKVCRVCGEPSRRIVETTNAVGRRPDVSNGSKKRDLDTDAVGVRFDLNGAPDRAEKVTLGWSDCGHGPDNWRPGNVLDPFAGSGTTLAVATGHGRNATGIDINSRNLDLARDRVGMFLIEASV